MSDLTEKARALADAATEGPWDVAAHDAEEFWFGAGYEAIEYGPVDEIGCREAVAVQGANEDGASHSTLAFIAEARTLVPALCDENEMLHELLDEWAEKCGDTEGRLDNEVEITRRLAKANEEQAARIRELEGALGYYADPASYRRTVAWEGNDPNPMEIQVDLGQRARDAMARSGGTTDHEGELDALLEEERRGDTAHDRAREEQERHGCPLEPS